MGLIYTVVVSFLDWTCYSCARRTSWFGEWPLLPVELDCHYCGATVLCRWFPLEPVAAPQGPPTVATPEPTTSAVTLSATSPSSAVSWAAGTNINSSLPLDLWATLEPSWAGDLDASLTSAVSDVQSTPPSNACMPQASTSSSSYHLTTEAVSDDEGAAPVMVSGPLPVTCVAMPVEAVTLAPPAAEESTAVDNGDDGR